MSAVTPQGTPTPPTDRAPWVVVAVGLSGVVLGYLLGSGGSGGGQPVASETTTTLVVSEPTTTTRPSRPTTAPATPLAERVPGLAGTLYAQVGRWETLPFTGPVLWTWPSARSTPLSEDTIPVTGIATADAGGGLFAGFGHAARGMVLSVGPPRSMRPALFDVSSYAWHVTDPGRLAWLEFTDEPRRYDLLVAEVAPNGTGPWLSPGMAVTAVDDARLVTWGDWGFLLATHFAPEVGETPEVIFLDTDGTERWRSPAGTALASAAGDVLLVGSYREVTDFFTFPSRYWALPQPGSGVRLVPASSLDDGANTAVEWIPDWTVGAAWSPDSTRLALAAWIEETDDYRIEVRTSDGDLVASEIAPGFSPAGVADRSITRSGGESFLHEYWSQEVAWSRDGRFVILPGWEPVTQRGRVLFYDTMERRFLEVEFPTPVHRAVVHRTAAQGP